MLTLAACGTAFSSESPSADGGDDADDAAADGPSPESGSGDATPSDGAPHCGNLSSDPANCGACGHSCLGAGCIGGVCQPLTLATGQEQPTSIIAYDDLTAPKSTRAIWAQTGASGAGALAHCHFGPADTCAPLALEAATNPRGLVGTAATMFWFDQAGTGAIESFPTVCSPCSATAVADTAVPDVGGSMDANLQFVFWTDDGAAPNGHLFGAPVGGGTASVLVTALTGSPTAVAIDGVAHAVDWVDGNIIEQCPASLAACMPTPIAALQTSPVPGAPSSLVAYGGSLYWTSPSDGAVAKCTPPSCLTSIAVLAKNLNQPVALTVDASGIYWVERGNTSPMCTGATGRVAMCPLAGCGAGPTVLSTGDACPSSVATSTRAVVWVDEGHPPQANGMVKAVAKP